MQGMRDYCGGKEIYGNKKYISVILLIAILFLCACGRVGTVSEKQSL